MANRANELPMTSRVIQGTNYGHVGAVIRTIGTEPQRYGSEEFWNCNIVDFDSKIYVVSHRAILTLVVVSGCNATCKFCSNEITYTPSGPYLRWGPKLARVKTFALTAGLRKVAFTGGEPTLNPQALFDLVTAMMPGFQKSRLHTNGIGLRREVRTPAGRVGLLDALITARLTGVSVSVAHHNPVVNAGIMRFGAAWPGMTDDDLRYVADRESRSFAPRLSCVMTPEGVATTADILEYMKWGRELGYRRFIFRSCSEIPEEFRKPTRYAAYNFDNHIPIDNLVTGLDRLSYLEKTFTQRKSDSKVDSYRWGDISFDIDESSEEPNPDCKVRRINVMPDGVAYVCWIDPLAVLFEDERPLAVTSMKREFRDLGMPRRR